MTEPQQPQPYGYGPPENQNPGNGYGQPEGQNPGYGYVPQGAQGQPPPMGGPMGPQPPKRSRGPIAAIAALAVVAVVLGIALIVQSNKSTTASPGSTVTVTETVAGSGGAGVTTTVAGPTVTVTRAGSGGGSGSAPDTSGAPTPTDIAGQQLAGKIGTPLPLSWASSGSTNKAATGSITINSAKSAATLGETDYLSKPKNGRFLVIDISYQATTGTISYNPFDWKIKTADGVEYETAFVSSSAGLTQLQSGKLTAGDKVRGSVVFDIPAGAMKLTYEIGYDGSAASWPIPA